MEMSLKRRWSSVCFWVFLVHLHLVASKHGQKTVKLFDKNTKGENLKVKVKKRLEAKTDIELQDVNSCDCRDYCPDPNNTELQVRFRKLVLYHIYSDNIRAVNCARHVSVYLKNIFRFHFSLMHFFIEHLLCRD